MPFLEVNGNRQFGTRTGEGTIPIVCLHGMVLGNSSTWLFPASSRVERGADWSLYCFDARGHGLSEVASAGYDLETQTRDLLRWLDYWELESAVLAGHSFGALVALNLALTQPERVRRLVLVEPPYPLSDQDGLMGFLQLSPAEMLDALPRDLEILLGTGERRRKRWFSRLDALLHRSTFVKDMAQERKKEGLLSGQCTVPSLVIAGKDSPCYPGIRTLAAKLPDSRFLEVNGGHYLLSDRPGPILDAMEAFLDG